MKILITGANGQLGYDAVVELEGRGHAVIGSDVAEKFAAEKTFPYVSLDITNAEAVAKTIEELAPDAVVHCAAWTNVDGAEDDANIETVRAVNVDGTANIAKACRKIDCKLIYISTDYVFDGQGDAPWKPDCKVYKPLNKYGQSKLDGEKAVKNTLEKYFIVRIAWVFGMNGKNFVKTMLRLGKERSELNVVADQIGSPTYTGDLAPLLVDMVQTDKYGLYHATNEGECTWAEFAEEIFKVAGIDVKVNHIATTDYHTKARRPMNSRMSKDILQQREFVRLDNWEEALRKFIVQMSYEKLI